MLHSASYLAAEIHHHANGQHFSCSKAISQEYHLYPDLLALVLNVFSFVLLLRTHSTVGSLLIVLVADFPLVVDA